MGSAFCQLCTRYSGTLTPTAPTAIRLWETFTFFTGQTQLAHFVDVMSLQDFISFVSFSMYPAGYMLNSQRR